MKLNINNYVFQKGGRLFSGSGLRIVDEPMDAFHFETLISKLIILKKIVGIGPTRIRKIKLNDLSTNRWISCNIIQFKKTYP